MSEEKDNTGYQVAAMFVAMGACIGLIFAGVGLLIWLSK